jgi:hypothetical protein
MWNFKQVAAKAAVGVVVLALPFLGISSAHADEATPPADPIVVAAPAAETPAPDPAPAVVTPEAPAPVVVAAPEAPAPVAVAPTEVAKPPLIETTTPTPAPAPATAPDSAKVATDTLPAPPVQEEKCVKTAKFSHTYDSSTNSGVITATGKFCGETFYVNPTEWAFTGNAVWGQDLVDTYTVTIMEPGTYIYGNPVKCGQGDIYAQWGTAIVPTAHLSGPSVEFKEDFLSNYSHGPTTYMVQKASCYMPPPPPVHTPATGKVDFGTFTCNTETYTVEGGNKLILSETAGNVWTITKDGQSLTLAAGAGFNAEPPFGVGTYTITGADADANDLIDATPVTTTATFVSAESVECTPPVVIKSIHPANPITTCNTITIPKGHLEEGDQPPYTDPETGAVITFSTYTVDEGGYYVTDTLLKGVHTYEIVFVAGVGYVVADNGPGDEYTVSTFDGVTRYAIWDPKPIVCPVVVIPTTPAPVVTTTTTVTKPVASVHKTAALASTGTDATVPGIVGLLLLLTGIGAGVFAKVRSRKAATQQ